MDPLSAAFNAVGNIFGPDSIFGAGRRAEYDRLPGWLTPDQVRRTDYTSYIILIAGTLILLVIILAIIRSK